MNLRIQWTPIALLSLSEVFEYTYEDLAEASGIEYCSILVISEIKLLYTASENTLFIEFVKNARMDDSTMLEKLNQAF